MTRKLVQLHNSKMLIKLAKQTSCSREAESSGGEEFLQALLSRTGMSERCSQLHLHSKSSHGLPRLLLLPSGLRLFT